MPTPLPLPTRVSRVYPILTLVFLLTSSSFLYAWQHTRIELEHLPNIEQRNQELEKQVESMALAQKEDQATLAAQKKEITDTAAKLADLQKQLQDSNDQLASKEKQISDQQSQLTSNASELASLRSRPPLFSFQNQSTLADVQTKQDDVKAVVSDAYSYIEQIYGEPYLLNSVTIDFVDALSIAGSSGETIISNGPKGLSITIRLKDFDKNSFQDINTVIHEMIHGFHGLAVFQSSALEEGITVAATDAVMTKMMAAGKIPPFTHLYLTTTPTTYSLWNQSLNVYADNNAFYSDTNVSEVYQLIGTAWYKLYQQDNQFFKNLNAQYYPQIQQGKNATTGLVLNSIRAVISNVGGESINTYLAENRAFAPN